MGLFPTAEPGSLLKPPTAIKAVDPPEKKFGAAKTAKGGDKKTDKADAGASAQADAAPADD